MFDHEPIPVTDANTQALSDIQKHMARVSEQLPIEVLHTFAPELPETKADEVYERVVEAERSHASPDLSAEGYEIGAAIEEDELHKVYGRLIMFSAEHATRQMRKGEPKLPDYGTAGLTIVAAEDLGAEAIVARGRQTSDANHAVDHPLKTVLVERIMDQADPIHSFASIHGMPGYYFNPELGYREAGPFDIIIGVGNNPSPETVHLASNISTLAADLGFNVGINQRFMKLDVDSAQPIIRSDGTTQKYAFISYRGANPNTTRSTVEQQSRANDMQIGAIQIELSDILRFMPVEKERRLNRDGTRDIRRIVMGVYCGYYIVTNSLAFSAEGK